MAGLLLSMVMLLGVIALNYYAYQCLRELRAMNARQGTPK